MTSKNGPIRTLFEESWLWVINLALRTRTPRGRGVRLNADKCGQGGRGVKNWQNFADVIVLTTKADKESDVDMVTEKVTSSLTPATT